MNEDEKRVATEAEFEDLIFAIRSGAADRVEEIISRVRKDIVNKIQSQFRQPPLYFAAIGPGDQNSYKIMKTLIEHGANANFKDQNQQTILFYVCRQGKQKCMDLLLKSGLSINDVDLYGQTPIFYTASENRLNIIHFFNSKDDINQIDKLALQTPLYYAARKGHFDMCKALIERGADVTHTDNQGKTAIQYARKAKFNEVADYLSAELKRIKEVNKMNALSQSINQQSNGDKNKKKKDENQPSRGNKQTFKLVLINDKGELHDLTEEEVRQLVRDKPELESYMANPDSITNQLIESSQAETWEKVANKVMLLCWKLKGAYWFQDPVDPVKYNIMDYFDIVNRPMDLGTIKRKMQHNAYASAKQFCDDMNLIWGNCYRYNGEHHDISKCAKELETGFNQYIKTNGLIKYL